MSLPHILLGMLCQPSSGYDLKKTFGDSLRHFWSAELSQIYPTLSRLEQQGLLRSQYEESDKGPQRRVYHRTADGLGELVDWLDGGPAHGQERLGFLAQVFFLSAVPMERRLHFMEQLRAGFAARLEALEAVQARWRGEDPGYPDALSDENFYAQLTLRMGLIKLGAMLDWCDECLVRIRARD